MNRLNSRAGTRDASRILPLPGRVGLSPLGESRWQLLTGVVAVPLFRATEALAVSQTGRRSTAGGPRGALAAPAAPGVEQCSTSLACFRSRAGGGEQQGGGL